MGRPVCPSSGAGALERGRDGLPAVRVHQGGSAHGFPPVFCGRAVRCPSPVQSGGRRRAHSHRHQPSPELRHPELCPRAPLTAPPPAPAINSNQKLILTICLTQTVRTFSLRPGVNATWSARGFVFRAPTPSAFYVAVSSRANDQHISLRTFRAPSDTHGGWLPGDSVALPLLGPEGQASCPLPAGHLQRRELSRHERPRGLGVGGAEGRLGTETEGPPTPGMERGPGLE